MELFIGTIFSLELSMIGSCHFYNPFLAFPLPLKLLGVGKTGRVPTRSNMFGVLLQGS